MLLRILSILFPLNPSRIPANTLTNRLHAPTVRGQPPITLLIVEPRLAPLRPPMTPPRRELIVRGATAHAQVWIIIHVSSRSRTFIIHEQERFLISFVQYFGSFVLHDTRRTGFFRTTCCCCFLPNGFMHFPHTFCFMHFSLSLSLLYIYIYSCVCMYVASFHAFLRQILCATTLVKLELILCLSAIVPSLPQRSRYRTLTILFPIV